jgi:hypothetical protein
MEAAAARSADLFHFCPRRPPECELFRWIFLFQKYFIPPVAFRARRFIVRFA